MNNENQTAEQSNDQQINVGGSNDSGIHEDGLDSNSQTDLRTKVTKETFQLPSWLANNQPIPDEILAKRSNLDHSTYHFDFDDEDSDDDTHPRPNPSAFYAFSFIDFSNDNEDAWSTNSVTAPNSFLGNEIKTCVETLHTCLNQFRQMNEQPQETSEPIDPSIENLLNDLIDQIETNQTNPNESTDFVIDFDLFNELFAKKLTLTEYLTLLDRLIDKQHLKRSLKTAEEVSNEILSLAEEIEQSRSIDLPESHSNEQHLDHQFMPYTQSSTSVISFLQQSTTMDISILALNDFSNQIQSTISTLNTQQQQQQPADIGKHFSKELPRKSLQRK